jgi:hypothetical protein
MPNYINLKRSAQEKYSFDYYFVFHFDFENIFPIKISTIQQKPTSNQVYIYSSYFGSFTSVDGSALYFNSETQIILIELSSFYKCSSTNTAGGIYCNSDSILLSKIVFLSHILLLK